MWEKFEEFAKKYNLNRNTWVENIVSIEFATYMKKNGIKEGCWIVIGNQQYSWTIDNKDEYKIISKDFNDGV